jgi:hypothetical protein
LETFETQDLQTIAQKCQQIDVNDAQVIKKTSNRTP